MISTNKKKIINRLKIIEGQIRGIQEMIIQEQYCIDITTQTSAVKQALSNTEDILMENHLSVYVIPQMKSSQVEKIKQEVLRVYELKCKYSPLKTKRDFSAILEG